MSEVQTRVIDNPVIGHKSNVFAVPAPEWRSSTLATRTDKAFESDKVVNETKGKSAKRAKGRPKKVQFAESELVSEKRARGRPPKNSVKNHINPVVKMTKLKLSELLACKPQQLAVSDRWRSQEVASSDRLGSQQSPGLEKGLESAACSTRKVETCISSMSIVKKQEYLIKDAVLVDKTSQISSAMPVTHTTSNPLPIVPSTQKLASNAALMDIIQDLIILKDNVSRLPQFFSAPENLTNKPTTAHKPRTAPLKDRVPEYFGKVEPKWEDEIEVDQKFDIDLKWNELELNVEQKPLLCSTPLKDNSPVKVLKKRGPRIRFRPYVEEFSACDDDLELSPKDVLARYASQNLLSVPLPFWVETDGAKRLQTTQSKEQFNSGVHQACKREEIS